MASSDSAGSSGWLASLTLPHIKTWHCGLALCVCLFAVYATTAPRSVALEDDALFIGNLHFFGVAHPPGYPLYTLAGGLLYHAIFFLDPAYKAHLISGIAATATCCALFIILRQLAIPLITATLTAFAYGVSKTFWSQAIIAEVYTFNTFLFFATTACILHAIQTNKWQWSIPILIACGLSVHHPLFILAGIGWIVFLPSLYRMDKKRFLWSPLIIAVIVIIFYGWMVWRSHANPVYNFSGIILEWNHLWYLVSRGVYANPLLVADWDNYAGYFVLFIRYCFIEFGGIGFVFAVIGSVVLFWQKNNNGNLPARRIGISLWLTFLCSSVVIILLTKFTHSQHQHNIFRVYPLIAYGVAAIWVAVGIGYIAQRFMPRHRQLITATISAVIAATILVSHWDFNNRRDEHWVEEFGRLVLDIPAPNSVLFLSGDWDLPLGYLHFVGKARPDLTLHSTNGLIYNTRIFPLRATAPVADPLRFAAAERQAKRDIINRYMHSQPHTAFYYTFNYGRLFEPYPATYYGFIHRFYLQPPVRPHNIGDATLHWLQKFNAATIYDPWTLLWRYRQNLYMAKQLTTLDEALLADGWRAYLRDVFARYPAIRIEAMVGKSERAQLSDAQAKETLEWLQTYQPPALPTFGIYETTEYYYLHARLIRQLHGEQHPDYAKNLERGFAVVADVENKNFAALLDYYAHHAPCRYHDFAHQFAGNTAMLQRWTRNMPAALVDGSGRCDDAELN